MIILTDGGTKIIKKESMKEERTIKELLQLMLEHKELFNLGLCSWVTNVKIRQIITFDERSILMDFIHNNRPSKYSSVSAFRNRDLLFYWEKNRIKPRIKWIKKHIARL
jgi:hypothetical protein